jgi:glucokinase
LIVYTKTQEIIKKDKHKNTPMVLGIDVGGTTVKLGVVTREGKISDVQRYSTEQWQFGETGFMESLKLAVSEYLMKMPEIEGVGIGFPGLLNKERNTIIRMHNIPGVKNEDVVAYLKKDFDSLTIRIDNDAKCAALGEMYFGKDKNLDDFMLATLGTGVGSGLVINKQLFLGVRGNAMELGHIIVSNGKTLEEQIGQQHISEYARQKLKDPKYKGSMLHNVEISPKTIYEAAEQGDSLSIDTYAFVGKLLGEALTTAVRILDVTRIILGGGVAGAFKFFEPAMMKVMKHYLPTYYLEDLNITTASLKENAGIQGAASLVYNQHDVFGKVLTD